VNPCPDEVAKIKAAGSRSSRSPEGRFQQERRPSTLLGVAILFGQQRWNNILRGHGLQNAYRFYRTRTISRRASQDSRQWRRTSSHAGAGNQRQSEIPVHPGLVKFLKEHKAWNDKWKVAGSK